jgi:glycosyltransferase involved in cell wall biosynthesis
MKIAQVSPLFESVPPKLYGGTERVVSYLTDQLVDMGHDVTLFASGDSKTKAKLVSITPKALRLGNCVEPFAHHILQLQCVIEMADRFDIIHFHTDYFHFPISKALGYVHLTTLHGRLNIFDLQALYKKFSDVPVVSISYSQRKPMPFANWIGTIYHGLPENLYSLKKGEGGYAAFLGRISPEKRVDRAIEITRQAGIPLKIAAKIDKIDQDYFDGEIKPLLTQPHVEFIGEIGENQKGDFLGNAKVTLFPIDWPEPFGMVMIESLANGTPVIAYSKGSVPEILDHGKTGFIVNSIEEAVAAINHIDRLSRPECRRIFMERFSANRMASDYCAFYQFLMEENANVQLPIKHEIKTNEIGNVLSA